MPLFLFLSNGNSYSTSERVCCGDDPVRYLENQMDDEQFMVKWGQFTRIEWFDANFHHHDSRAPLWCVRSTGTGYANPYPKSAWLADLTPVEDYSF